MYQMELNAVVTILVNLIRCGTIICIVAIVGAIIRKIRLDSTEIPEIVKQKLIEYLKEDK